MWIISSIDKSNIDKPKYFAVISIFPQIFRAISDFGITKRAIDTGKAIVDCINPRDFVSDNYRRIDDRPFGGGAGMVMLASPLIDAINHAKVQAKQHNVINCPVVYLSPQGSLLNENGVVDFLNYDGMILLCGRYDGIDERVMAYVDVEISIGDYVLTGGELPAMVLMDSIIRRLPSVMNDEQSAVDDSFVDGLLDYPQYTRPVVLDIQDDKQNSATQKVPDILLSGHHEKIAKWRFFQKLDRTLAKKPALFDEFIQKDLSKTQQKWLKEYLATAK